LQDHINSILKDRWYDLTDKERDTWRDWEVWDAKRYEYQMKIYAKKDEPSSSVSTPALSIPKKSIPKKRKV
jgi:hypothetical protein